ncbi:gamma-interferon-inducible lysosomal thiol reductase-like [Hypanus sabinus]|uniref:gamma-interferon-inducible lysosomal thiol reductase-like n=1 Tax=Hypanus sabinus TaxID=79690 RepID=UPI0028C4C728|nr:gamma-interferon-inducible lysosomal thiol reductase-like [Hypanus sabinus]
MVPIEKEMRKSMSLGFAAYQRTTQTRQAARRFDISRRGWKTSAFGVQHCGRLDSSLNHWGRLRQQVVYAAVGRGPLHSSDLSPSLSMGESRCTPAETGRWPPVHIRLFYETLCPDCRAFMENELCPTWARMKEFLNVTLIPFGNAEVIQSTQSQQFQCQCGRKECLGNMIQSCMIYHLKNTSSYLPVICCMESAHTVLIAAQQCLQEHAPSVSWEIISDCVNEDLGSQLMYQNAQRTNELEPPHHYVPWILINGEHFEDTQHHAETDLLDLVCRTYTAPPPKICDQSVST